MSKSVRLVFTVMVVLTALFFSVQTAQVSSADKKPEANASAKAKQMPLQGPYYKDTGNCWTVAVSQHESTGDTVKEGTRSKLVLYENGKPLGPAHSSHSEIRAKGNGRYSHWGGNIYFSASDNSDPNKNGKKYTFSH